MRWVSDELQLVVHYPFVLPEGFAEWGSFPISGGPKIDPCNT